MYVCVYIYIYSDGQFAWLKYFIYSFVLVLAPKYKQHIFSSYN
jgi:hypothetical protein